VSYTNTFLVDIDGSPLPQDVAPLLIAAYVDDSQRLPDLFELRFRDPEHLVLAKTGVKIGSALKVSVMTSTSQAPAPLMTGEVTALEVDFDAAGTFTVVRGYDAAHRLFRGRSTHAYTQMTASDIATQVARRVGLQVGDITATTTVYEHVTQAGTNDWELLQRLADDVGFEITVRDGKFGFGPPAAAAAAPAAGGPRTTNPLVLRSGVDLLRFRAVVTAAEQVKEVEVRSWDPTTKQPLISRVPAETATVQLHDLAPADLARAFGDPRYVSGDVPHRTQAEVDTASKSLSEAIAGAFAEFEGVVRGNPEVRANTAVTVDNLGAPFDGKYTVTSSRHRFDPNTGYTTSFAVTGAQDRTMLGLASGGGQVGSAPDGVVVATVNDVNDPEQLGRIKLQFPWLADDFVSGWARTVQAGAGKDRGGMVLPEVGDEVLVLFEHGDVRRPYVLGGLYNGVDKPSARGIPLVDSGSGAVNRRSMVSRLGHRIDLQDDKGRNDGIKVVSVDEKVGLLLDAAQTKVTVHADGTVVIEGTKGITVDSSNAKLELKGGEITITATNGVRVDGGTGQLQLKGATASLQGTTTTEVKGGSLCSVSAGLVKIN
jgi:uncharacterized protein involved in type VI secretion and phage assembly